MTYTFDLIQRKKWHELIGPMVRDIIDRNNSSHNNPSRACAKGQHLIEARNQVIDKLFPLGSLIIKTNDTKHTYSRKEIHKGYKAIKVFDHQQLEFLLPLAEQALAKRTKGAITNKEERLFFLDNLISCNAISSVINSANKFTNYNNFIWNLHFMPVPQSSSSHLSHAEYWHYDNHYSRYCTKVIVYLNQKPTTQGATDVADFSRSYKFSIASEYIGSLSQTKTIESYKSKAFHEYQDLMDTYYRFTSVKSGTGLVLHPSQCLHRRVAPTTGIRHAISFSLIPFSRKDSERNICPLELSIKAIESSDVDYLPVLDH